MYRLIIIILALLFVNCSETSHPITSGSTDSTNIPQLINTENYFSFKIIADSLTASFHNFLTFNTDSLHADLQVSNLNNYSSGIVKLKNVDSLAFYLQYLSFNILDSDVNLFGNSPYEIDFSLKRYSGELSFILERKRHRDSLDTIGTRKHPDAVYFNSFESLEDISQFDGRGIGLQYDVSPGGGQKSLCVTGGWGLPNAQYTFPPAENDSYYLLQCWGKAPWAGGVVSLKLTKFGGPLITLNINSIYEGWNFYRTPDTLFCPKDSTLMLRLGAYDFNYNYMLVDLIQIVEVEK